MPVKNNQRKARQYLRWLPAQIGLVNKASFVLNIDKIYKDDIFVVSYPKSGNTWVRFLIANILNPDVEIFMSNINDFVPDVYTSKEIINHRKNNRLIKSHHALFGFYPRIIYVVRDYRDAMVSNYHRFVSRKNFKGSFDEFIDSKIGNLEFGSWQSHVLGAYSEFQKRPNQVLILKYEDLIHQPELQIKRIADFLAVKNSYNPKEVMEKSSFDKLHKSEPVHPGIVKPMGSDNFFRKGKTGEWMNYFSTQQLNEIKKSKDIVMAMEMAGYEF